MALEKPKVFAKSEDIPEEPFKEIELPVMGRWVRVRRLGQTEIIRLAFMPDMARFAELMGERLLNGDQPEDREVTDAILARMQELEIQTARYRTLLAHIAVWDGSTLEPSVCEDCGLEHAPALWGRDQTERMETPDLQMISEVAEGQDALRDLRPFSPPTSQSDTDQPPSTGESTPQQSS